MKTSSPIYRQFACLKLQQRGSHGIQEIGGSIRTALKRRCRLIAEGHQPGMEEKVGEEYGDRIKDVDMENFASENDN